MLKNSIERYSQLMSHNSVENWRNQVFELGKDIGYEQTLLAIFPNRYSPVEAEFAFLHSNYSAKWRNKYDDLKLGHVDPTVTHCAIKSTPLIWSPDIFTENKQKNMYEEACSHGLRSGVTLPIHGSDGELGVLCFVSDASPNKNFQRDTCEKLPELSYFRDLIYETSLQFMHSSKVIENIPSLTHCESECLKWYAVGKSSSDIAQILNCSIAAVNFHFSNLRIKFNVSTRQQVLVKAMHQRLIDL